MKISEVLHKTATMLELPEGIFGGNLSPATRSKELRLLVECFNNVLNEIAEEYVPFLREDEAQTVLGKIYYTQFDERVYKVEAVHKDGEAVRFRCMSDHIRPDKEGLLTVRYRCLPLYRDYADEVVTPTNVTERLVALGVAAEYALVVERYPESVKFSEKYMSALRSAMTPAREIKMQGRSWT